MVNCYYYNELSMEYVGSDTAPLNPVATKREGKEVYSLPRCSTFTKPPRINKLKTALYDKESDDWQIVDDLRGEYIVNAAMDLRIMAEIGSLPAGYIHVTAKQAQKIKEDPIYYVVQDGELVKNPDYEEIKAQQEAERIARLSITKYDFYKAICQPNGLGYQQVMTLVNSNDEIAAAWHFCERVYRGDELLNTYIKQFIPAITDEQLDDIFNTLGK